MQNYFERLGQPVQFSMDFNELQAQFEARIKALHPDKFSQATKPEQKVATKLAAEINEAYAVLKDPIQRAKHILDLKGKGWDEHCSDLSPAFLELQIALRERWQELCNAGNPITQQQFLEEIKEEQASRLIILEAVLVQGVKAEELNKAQEALSELLFYNRLAEEVYDIT